MNSAFISEVNSGVVIVIKSGSGGMSVVNDFIEEWCGDYGKEWCYLFGEEFGGECGKNGMNSVVVKSGAVSVGRSGVVKSGEVECCMVKCCMVSGTGKTKLLPRLGRSGPSLSMPQIINQQTRDFLLK